MSANTVSRDKLITDFKVVVQDAEELLKATAATVGEKSTVVRQRIEENLREAKAKLAQAEAIVIDKTKEAAEATDTYVRANPWQAVGIAAGLGFLVGVLVSRR
ncbi:MAG: hypothetical protein B9S32_14370 [Verrucomicrobia bacterium Tous-C9LFEB]|nr:MAG: hypothetical protein B9S32_14370 [Verrucomicrobia bacterium Tous-C9LFEB]